MTNSIAKKITEASGHYIDWTRVGELLASGNHHYTWEQLMTRAGIIMATLAGGYVFHHQQPLHTFGFSASANMATGALTGFFVSHLLVIAPLVHKRIILSRECQSLQKIILQELEKMGDSNLSKEQSKQLIDVISAHIDYVMHYSLSTETRGNASQTWGYRKRLMVVMKEQVQENKKVLKGTVAEFEGIVAFWSFSSEEVIKKLSEQHKNSDFKKKR